MYDSINPIVPKDDTFHAPYSSLVRIQVYLWVRSNIVVHRSQIGVGESAFSGEFGIVGFEPGKNWLTFGFRSWRA